MRSLTSMVRSGKTRLAYVERGGSGMTAKVEKVTISLPPDLVRITDEIARETQTNRSKVISSCLRELAERRLQEQMEEGYRAMAKEHRGFASVAMNLASEILPEW